MGGPSASIILSHALTEHQVDEFERWLASITTQLNGVRGEWNPLWLKDGRFIDMPELEPDKTCAFGVTISPYWWELDFLEDGTLDPEALEEQDQLLQLLGYVPEQRIILWAGCNGDIDHQILGRLILQVAQKYQGLIDFAGAIYPPMLPFQMSFIWDSGTVEDIENYVASLALPGQIFHIYYTAAGGKRWLWHIMDIEFFRAWLHHPRFRLTK